MGPVEEIDLVIRDPTPEIDPIRPDEIVARFASELKALTSSPEPDGEEDLEDIPKVGPELRTYFTRQALEPEQDHLSRMMICSL